MNLLILIIKLLSEAKKKKLYISVFQLLEDPKCGSGKHNGVSIKELQVCADHVSTSKE